MSGLPVPPRRVYGLCLDASPMAGDRTWFCRATPGQQGVRIESLDVLSDLPGGASERTAAFRSLVIKISETPRAAWGVDGPLALPISDPGGLGPAGAGRSHAWEAMLRWVLETADPSGLLEPYPPVAPGGEQLDVPRRQVEQGGVPAALGPAALERTYYVLRELVAPLARMPGVLLLPFDPLPLMPPGTPPAMQAGVASIYVMEVAAARLLAAAGADPAGRAAEDGRRTALQQLARGGWLRPLPRRLRECAVADQRAFDALAAAVAAQQGSLVDHVKLHADARLAAEGYVYP